MSTSLKSLLLFLLEVIALVPRLVLFLLTIIIGLLLLGIMVFLLGLQVVFQVLALGASYLTKNFLQEMTTRIALLTMLSLTPFSTLLLKKDQELHSTSPDDLATDVSN